MSDISPIKVFQEWLDSYLNFEKLPKKNIFWLDTMNYLCNRFDHPEQNAPSFHVAGSKGKGSTSVMIASILCEDGYNTGLYTSPHILDFIERIQSASGPFDEKVYESAVKKIMAGIDAIIPESLPGKRPITWFELVTLFAFLTFKIAKTDYNVFEVGLGGRLDATNVITPKICCINLIEKEHTEYLGDTLEQIACEKGGIIKRCVPVVVSHQRSEVRKVIESIAQDKNAPVIFIDDIIDDINYEYIHTESETGMKIKISSKLFSRPINTTLKLLGEYQAYNAALAAVTVKKALPGISEEIIEKGLAKASLPGRFELIKKVKQYPDIPCVVLDGAHTVNSVSYTIDTYKKLFGQYGKTNLLFACAADKDSDDIAPLFEGMFENVFLTKPGDVKISDITKLTQSFDKVNIKYLCDSDYKKQIEKAFKAANDNKKPLLITGSFYLIAEVKKILSEIN